MKIRSSLWAGLALMLLAGGCVRLPIGPMEHAFGAAESVGYRLLLALPDRQIDDPEWPIP